MIALSASGRRGGALKRGEHGQAGAEILFFAFVLVASSTLVVANAWAVVDAKFMVTGAAREGARVFVESPDDAAAHHDALAAADLFIERSGGKLARRTRVDVVGALHRCERIVVAVGYQIPQVNIPVLGFRFGTRTVTASQSEIVDPFRSGLEGEVSGACRVR